MVAASLSFSHPLVLKGPSLRALCTQNKFKYAQNTIVYLRSLRGMYVYACLVCHAIMGYFIFFFDAYNLYARLYLSM
jgi:hypothetical protein